MYNDIDEIINEAALNLIGVGNTNNAAVKTGEASGTSRQFPERRAIIEIIHRIRPVIFWEHYSGLDIVSALREIYEKLSEQAEIAYSTKEGGARARLLARLFIEELSTIRQTLLKDAKAGFDGDPAAVSIDEIILTYPGMFAVFVYRIAHALHIKGLPLIPRIMTEYSHNTTGIDIHPGAEIGEYFFIDHGTCVVIGETAVIGNHVKLYQGVTLGALSTGGGQKLAGRKRHPTIEDNVTVYSGATILGGETVIGENSVIGGNVFITRSVPKNSKVKIEVK